MAQSDHHWREGRRVARERLSPADGANRLIWAASRFIDRRLGRRLTNQPAAIVSPPPAFIMAPRSAKPKPADQLTPEEAEVELARLATEIAEHDRRYYLEEAPTISDAEYDALRQRNDAIEKLFPDLVRPDSPSKRVGAKPSGRFRKVRHSIRCCRSGMPSRKRTSSNSSDASAASCGLSSDHEIPFTAEPKIDGLSSSLRYERGELAAWRDPRRRDRGRGRDPNIRTIGEIPSRLPKGASRDRRSAWRGLHELTPTSPRSTGGKPRRVAACSSIRAIPPRVRSASSIRG